MKAFQARRRIREISEGRQQIVKRIPSNTSLARLTD